AVFAASAVGQAAGRAHRRSRFTSTSGIIAAMTPRPLSLSITVCVIAVCALAVACGQNAPKPEPAATATPAPAAPPPIPPVRVFVTNETSGDLTVIDAATQTAITTAPLGKRPRGIQPSPDGKSLYVALSGSPPAPP